MTAGKPKLLGHDKKVLRFRSRWRTRFSLPPDTGMADPGAQAFRHSCSPHLCMKSSLDLNAVSDYMDKEMAFGF